MGAFQFRKPAGIEWILMLVTVAALIGWMITGIDRLRYVVYGLCAIYFILRVCTVARQKRQARDE